MRAFYRRCRWCRRHVSAAASLPVKRQREMAASFAAAHLAHFRELSGEEPHRCKSCGLLLLWTDRCPEHPYAEPVLWEADLAVAFGQVVDAVAAGDSVVVQSGAAGDVTHRAYRLAREWGMNRDLNLLVRGELTA